MCCHANLIPSDGGWEARPLLADEEAEKLINNEQVTSDALEAAEQVEQSTSMHPAKLLQGKVTARH